MLATTIHKSNTTPHHQVRRQHEPPHPSTHNEQKNPEAGTHPHRGEPAGLLSQDPTVCLAAPGIPTPKRGRPRPGQRFVHRAPEPDPLQTRAHPTNPSGKPGNRALRAGPNIVVLLRKEVIQPHLPVRLPCYDFVPIADPTFDGSLHKG